LIPATACARVIDKVALLALTVWITGVDAAKVCQERDQAAVALIDAIAYAMRAIDFGPGE
jgi:hypothetical protein